MTIGKTIKILEDLWKYEHSEKFSEKDIREALDMAIKSLEQADGDLISRQAVIDLLNRFIEVEKKQGTDVMNYGRERVNAYESVLWEIESDYLFPSLPSAEQTAEWIDSKDVIEITQEIQHHYMCSKCGMYFDRMTKYCPNCGSRMKKESEEADK